MLKLYNSINCAQAAVKWLKYCRYSLKHQSMMCVWMIKLLFKSLTVICINFNISRQKWGGGFNKENTNNDHSWFILSLPDWSQPNWFFAVERLRFEFNEDPPTYSASLGGSGDWDTLTVSRPLYTYSITCTQLANSLWGFTISYIYWCGEEYNNFNQIATISLHI